MLAGVLKNFEEVNFVKLAVVVIVVCVVVIAVVIIVVVSLGQSWEMQAEDRPSDFAL